MACSGAFLTHSSCCSARLRQRGGWSRSGLEDAEEVGAAPNLLPADKRPDDARAWRGSGVPRCKWLPDSPNPCRRHDRLTTAASGSQFVPGVRRSSTGPRRMRTRSRRALPEVVHVGRPSGGNPTPTPAALCRSQQFLPLFVRRAPASPMPDRQDCVGPTARERISRLPQAPPGRPSAGRPARCT